MDVIPHFAFAEMHAACGDRYDMAMHAWRKIDVCRVIVHSVLLLLSAIAPRAIVRLVAEPGLPILLELLHLDLMDGTQLGISALISALADNHAPASNSMPH